MKIPLRTFLFISILLILNANLTMANEQKVRTPFLENLGQIPPEEMERQSILFPNIAFIQGAEDEKVVALTFDDGPSADTKALLDVLKRNNVKATFFWQGKAVIKNTSLVKRAYTDGHTLGNHSWDHPYITKIESNNYWKAQIQNTQNAYSKKIGITPRLFRPPYGYITDKQIVDFDKRNMKILLWSVASDDWYFSDKMSEPVATSAITTQVLSYIHPGAIVLLHDAGGKNRIPTVQAVQQLIFRLKLLGYRFVTIDELLHISPYLESTGTSPQERYNQFFGRSNNYYKLFVFPDCYAPSRETQ